MMHRCSSSHVGPCSCGLFHSKPDSFSMLLSVPNHRYNTTNYDMYSSVDCTLSLGTPSTRLSEDVDDCRRVHHDRRPSSSSSGMSNFCWDMFQNKNAASYPTSSHSSKSNTSRASNSSGNNSLPSNDPLLARRCANCDTTSTPLWRNGPRGPKSLCNACGIRFKKEERRTTAANANSGNENKSGGSGMDYRYNNNSTWVQSQKMACFSPSANELRFIEDNDRDSDSSIPFLSWRLNLADRPGLVHDFTR